MLLFIVNLGHEEVKIIKGHTLAYLAPAEETNKESETTNISAAPSETKVELLPAIPSNSKMIFPDDHTPVRKVLLQDAKILV